MMTTNNIIKMYNIAEVFQWFSLLSGTLDKVNDLITKVDELKQQVGE